MIKLKLFHLTADGVKFHPCWTNFYNVHKDEIHASSKINEAIGQLLQKYSATLNKAVDHKLDIELVFDNELGLLKFLGDYS